MLTFRNLVTIGTVAFVGNLAYHVAETEERIESVEHAVVAIADDVQEIKQAVIGHEPVTKLSKRAYSKKEFDCLARNIYYEAGVEDTLGKLAVAQVTLNRVKTGYWGDTICDVVYAPSQFSWTKIKKRAWLQVKGPLWEESVSVAHQVLNDGTRVEPLKRALFYHADYVNPFWKDKQYKIAQIGTHIFYTQAKGSWLKL